jgi:hypothetical protein
VGDHDQRDQLRLGRQVTLQERQGSEKIRRAKLPSRAWSVALVAVLFLVGVGVAAAAALVPTFGVTAIAIGLLLALRVKIKALALILVAACLLGPSLEEGLGIDALTYVDEAASIFLGIIVPIGSKLFGRKIVRLPGQNLLLVTLGLGLVSSLLQGVGTASFGQGAFLLMKMPLLAFGFAQLPWNARDVERIARVIVGVVIPVVALSVVANVYYGLDWIRALSGSGGGGYVDYRYGLLSSQGLFDHPLILGNVAGILVMGAFATSAHLGHIRFARAATVVAFVASLASFRRTAIVGVLAAVFVAWPRKARGVLVVGSFILIPVALFVLASEIQETLTATLDEYVYTDAPAARTRLLLGSFQVASEHAPFGAGFARYGSYLAGVDYSPEYIKLGFDGVWGLSNMPGMSGAFLTDTQWPVLIGETGWIGAAAFVGFLIAILRTFLRAGKRDEAHLQWISTFGRGALVVTAFASIGLPVFTSTPIASLFYTIVGIGVALLSAAGAEPVRSLPRFGRRAKRTKVVTSGR